MHIIWNYGSSVPSNEKLENDFGQFSEKNVKWKLSITTKVKYILNYNKDDFKSGGQQFQYEF